jgi:hypothetical protein
MSTCANCIPALDYNPDSFFSVATPTPFELPQQNPFAKNLTGEEICLLIAGFCAILGITPTAAQLETYAANYSCMPQDSMIPALNKMLTMLLIGISTAASFGFVYGGVYGSAGPLFIPFNGVGVAIDSNTYRQWQYYSGGWH